MEKPLEIQFHQMAPSAAIEARIHEKAARLERHWDRITSCRVVVEQDHRQHQKGNLFRVRIEIGVPGKELVVTRKGARNHAHEDPMVALRDAFAAADRQLEDYARERRGKVKTHEVPPHGRVRMLDPSGEFGFIGTADGHDIYFHRNSVANGGFDQLEVGSEVRFVIAEGEGEQGPQASTVHPIGKHHLEEPTP